MRFTTLLGVAAAALVMQAGLSAQAGLVNGTNAVSALYFFGVRDDNNKETELTAADTPPPFVIPADFVQGVSDGSTIHVGDTQITIVNKISLPFCFFTPQNCVDSDSFNGFEFQFSAGVNITGVKVDPLSAADFQPQTSGQHKGLQLLSATDILVDLTNDAPNIGDQLILDLTFPTTTPVPEPMSLALLGIGLVGIGAARSRARRRAR